MLLPAIFNANLNLAFGDRLLFSPFRFSCDGRRDLNARHFRFTDARANLKFKQTTLRWLVGWDGPVVFSFDN